MRNNNLLAGLTFIGGTCLRCCYGGTRLSEDLDFTGGIDFKAEDLSKISEILIKELYRKYELNVSVTNPSLEEKNVKTWKVKIQVRNETKHLAAQRINIDICSLPSYEKQPMLIKNYYGIDMGTSGLIIQAQSLREIYIDKIIAFALRPNRIKYRDLWDILWLYNQNIEPGFQFLKKKLTDRNCDEEDFKKIFSSRVDLLKEEKKIKEEFKKEMIRFLPLKQVNEFIIQDGIWDFICYMMDGFKTKIKSFL